MGPSPIRKHSEKDSESFRKGSLMANPAPDTRGLWRGRSPGRSVGTPNRATQEIRRLCGELLSDPLYRENFTKRFRNGLLAPQLERMIWEYFAGRPPQSVEFTSSGLTLAEIIVGSVPPEPEQEEDAPPNCDVVRTASPE